LHGNEIDDEENKENKAKKKKKSSPKLDVTSKDSPYALIDEFFPEREILHK